MIAGRARFEVIALINRVGIAANISVTVGVGRGEIMTKFVADYDDIPHNSRIIQVKITRQIATVAVSSAVIVDGGHQAATACADIDGESRFA